MTPNKIQPQEYSKGSATDGTLHMTDGSLLELTGNRYVAYAELNDNGRNLNLDDFDNRWNRRYRFLAVRNSLYVRNPTDQFWLGCLYIGMTDTRRTSHSGNK